MTTSSPSGEAQDGTVAAVDVLAASVARVRRAGGMTLSAVAARAGVSPAYVSQMESGAANPTVRTLAAIAEAMGTTPAELLGGERPSAPEPTPPFAPRFTPAPLLARTAGHRGIWDLGAPGAALLRPRLLHADLGDHAGPVSHPGEEFVTVLAGSCRLAAGGTTHLLRPGDSVHLAAGDSHHCTDPSDDLLMLVVLTQE
ncbi:helix-turn-helix domain-containing protein [Streptomyces sp. NPDC060194]|uniref:helix-turn-helix domain-containing protein n=1 Tax=Streptomyces sp. NPDC060194 TaxID=3347069 RepID=UPI0036657CE7